MSRTTVRRILITIGITAGLLTTTAGPAAAALNHSAPTLRRP